MNEHLQFAEMKRLERVREALEKNHFEAHVVATAAEVVPLVQKLLPKGGTVSNGGSMSLAECGVMDLLRNGEYNFLDREAPGANLPTLFRQTFLADAYVSSANAVTEDGKIVQMDARSNRVAAIAFGPASVVLVVGKNKIVPDVAAARTRIQKVAGPANCHRLASKTPCATTGECVDCNSPGRLCCTEMILHGSIEAGRIKVILVGEDLGY